MKLLPFVHDDNYYLQTDCAGENLVKRYHRAFYPTLTAILTHQNIFPNSPLNPRFLPAFHLPSPLQCHPGPTTPQRLTKIPISTRQRSTGPPIFFKEPPYPSKSSHRCPSHHPTGHLPLEATPPPLANPFPPKHPPSPSPTHPQNPSPIASPSE